MLIPSVTKQRLGRVFHQFSSGAGDAESSKGDFIAVPMRGIIAARTGAGRCGHASAIRESSGSLESASIKSGPKHESLFALSPCSCSCLRQPAPEIMIRCYGSRARRRAEREAIYASLQYFSVIQRTRGGRPRDAHIAESET